jgi:hypothetical protein
VTILRLHLSVVVIPVKEYKEVFNFNTETHTEDFKGILVINLDDVFLLTPSRKWREGFPIDVERILRQCTEFGKDA